MNDPLGKTSLICLRNKIFLGYRMLSVDETLNELRDAFLPNQCFARTIDHREMIEIDIKSPTGELLFSVDPKSRDELLSEKNLQLFIVQIKRRIAEKS